MSDTKKKESENLILQRSVSAKATPFKMIIKDPNHDFKVVGYVHEGSFTERGQKVPVYNLFDLKGQHVCTERDRNFLEDDTIPQKRKVLEKAALQRWKEDELETARKKAEKAEEKDKSEIQR